MGRRSRQGQGTLVSSGEVHQLLSRVRAACKHDEHIAFPHDTREEMREIGFTAPAAMNVLAALKVTAFHKRVVSQNPAYAEAWLWVFTPQIDEDLALWIRIVETTDPPFTVISFHDRDRDRD